MVQKIVVIISLRFVFYWYLLSKFAQIHLFFQKEKYASSAVMEMRGRVLNGRKIQIDFASRECQAAFSEHLSKQGPSVPAERPWERREIEK